MTQDAHKEFTCLAIELAAGVGSVAACIDTQTSCREYPVPSLQSREIYSGVNEVLEDLGLELAALDCIAFGCGPGAFTGLRVAAAAAQALAYGVGIPVARVSSLASLAAGAVRRHSVDCVAPCFDARMGEAYLGVYSGDSSTGLQEVVADCLVDPEQFRLASDLSFFAAGPGWSAYPALLENHPAQIVGSDFTLMPSAVDLLLLASRQFCDGLTVSAAEALPNYIRDKVTY